MAKEQDTEPQPEFTSRPEPDHGVAGNSRNGISRVDGQDPYDLAEAHFMAEVERLQQAGELRRASQITNEEELDDHFDDLLPDCLPSNKSNIWYNL